MYNKHLRMTKFRALPEWNESGYFIEMEMDRVFPAPYCLVYEKDGKIICGVIRYSVEGEAVYSFQCRYTASGNLEVLELDETSETNDV